MHGKEILLIGTIALYGVLVPISNDVYLPGLPTMVKEFDTSVTVMNASLYMYLLVTGVYMLFAGPLSDKFGRRRFLEATLLSFVIFSVLCCFVTDIHVFLLLKMGMGIGSSTAMVTSIALVKDLYVSSKRERVLGIVAIGATLGGIIVPTLSSRIFEGFGWRGCFVFIAIVGVMCMVLGLLIPKDLPAKRLECSIISTIKVLGPILKKDGFILYLMMIGIVCIVQPAYSAISSYVYQDYFDITPINYGLIMSFGMLATAILSAILLRLRLPNSKNHMLILILLMMGVVLAALGASVSWLGMLISVLPLLCVPILVRSFGFEILMSTHDGDNGSLSSVLAVSMDLFAFIGMFILSIFPTHLFLDAYLGLVVAVTVIYVLLWYILKRRGYPVKGMV